MHSDSGKSGGFFNKVMHLVRGNAAAASESSADFDGLGAASDDLKEVRVRKRRNEAIRRHEFAQLRLLRNRNEVGGQSPLDDAGKDDELLSMLGQETRSTETLQKIDAIEAQMSGQWWRNPAQAAVKGDKPPLTRKLNARQLSDLPVLGEDSVVQPAPPPMAPANILSAASDVVCPVKVAPEPVEVEPSAEASEPAELCFLPSPDLEEAAILFAHGDIDGARARLLEQLLQALSTEPVNDTKAAVLWHAALDLCRALGDEEAFEPLAIDYAEHFGRSAPLWSSMPERLGLPPLKGDAPAAVKKRQFQWSCPSVLTAGAVAALRVSQEEAPQPWSMSWLRLTSIEEAALQPLAQLFDAWASSQGQFLWSDVGKLLQLLEQQTPVGEGAQPEQWWSLRMSVLRLLHRMDEYEQVALDYCITYEVSPPSWVEPDCLCVAQEEGAADVSILQEASLHSAHPATPGTVAAPTPVAKQGLAGVLEGDSQPWLDALTAQAKSGQVLEVACDNLIRLDFVAAGGILNWAADMQSQGYVVRFTNLHQLVAVFFCVIGIHEHAQVQATIN